MSESAEELNTLPDFERWETFWVGGQRVGALHRVWQDSVLLTRIAIEDESGDYLAESRIRFVPGPDWDLSWFHSSGMDEPVLLHNPANWTHTGSLPVVTAESLTALDGRELGKLPLGQGRGFAKPGKPADEGEGFVFAGCTPFPQKLIDLIAREAARKILPHLGVGGVFEVFHQKLRPVIN